MGQWVLWAASAAALAISTIPQEVIFWRQERRREEKRKRLRREEKRKRVRRGEGGRGGEGGRKKRRRREVSVAAMNVFITEVCLGFSLHRDGLGLPEGKRGDFRSRGRSVALVPQEFQR